MQNIKDILAANGISDEDVVSKIEAGVLANYRTVSEVEGKNEKLANANEKISAANAKIDELTAALESAQNLNTADAESVKKLQDQLAEFKAKSEAEAAAAAEKQAKEEFAKTFNEALGDRKFANPLIAHSVSETVRAIAEKNPDMNVSDIIESTTKDMAGVWTNPQREVHVMQQGGTGMGDKVPITNLSQLKGMSAHEVLNHMDEVNALLQQ